MCWVESMESRIEWKQTIDFLFVLYHDLPVVCLTSYHSISFLIFDEVEEKWGESSWFLSILCLWRRIHYSCWREKSTSPWVCFYSFSFLYFDQDVFDSLLEWKERWLLLLLFVDFDDDCILSPSWLISFLFLSSFMSCSFTLEKFYDTSPSLSSASVLTCLYFGSCSASFFASSWCSMMIVFLPLPLHVFDSNPHSDM